MPKPTLDPEKIDSYYGDLTTVHAPEAPNSPNYARRRRVAAAIVGLAITPWLVRAGIDSYHYGYHPSQNANSSAHINNK
jgi:hypothetical protein